MSRRRRITCERQMNKHQIRRIDSYVQLLWRLKRIARELTGMRLRLNLYRAIGADKLSAERYQIRKGKLRVQRSVCRGQSRDRYWVQLSLTFKLQLSIYQIYIQSIQLSFSNLTCSLDYTTITQGKSRRDIQPVNPILIKLENKGPKLDELALYIIILIIQGKQNQYSKVKYIGCIRNTNPILYPLSIIAFYFFNRQGKDSAKSFLSFQQLEDYYNLYIFPSSIKVL